MSYYELDLKQVTFDLFTASGTNNKQQTTNNKQQTTDTSIVVL